jgi:hypothetical protein
MKKVLDVTRRSLIISQDGEVVRKLLSEVRVTAKLDLILAQGC